MVRKLIEWSLNNPLISILVAVTFAAVGLFSFFNVNVEAYPDPAPAIVEVIALFPGASAEEVERQVTIPLEVTFAGMPGLNSIHSKSLFGLSDLKMNWNYGSQWTYEAARQEVINRMTTISQPLPPGVSPQISPESPTGEIYRYILKVPKDRVGREIYTLNDIKALQDWVLEREFRTVPRIVDVSSFGGTVRRYEVQPDPNRLRLKGITLSQLQTALANSNANVGGDYVNQGQVAMTVRSVGLFGGGQDPVNKVLGFENQALEEFISHNNLTEEQAKRIREAIARRKLEPPLKDEEQDQVDTIDRRAALRAARVLRGEEFRRIRDIRSLVVSSVNNQPVRVEDVVEGGRISPSEIGEKGVVVTHRTRLGRIGYFRADQERPSGSSQSLAEVGHDEDDKVQCIVLLRKNEQTLPALRDVNRKVEELNDPASGRILPGVEIEPYYDRAELVRLTTETVTENLLLGMALVTMILLMFISNVRTALIVAINIPLALLFAFSMLYLRDKSANLLSIGAVDFGIIVDSSVIIAENIYRYLTSQEGSELPLRDRILMSTREIDRALLFSTLIMVCAFIPLFTMKGPEGQLFGPMAQTYAFSLIGALFLAVTLTPVLCLLFFKNLKPTPDNFLVRNVKSAYLWLLRVCLRFRWATVIVFAVILLATACLIPFLGHEFMPELEEGNVWIRSIAPLNQTLERNIEIAKQGRAIIASYPEVEAIVSQSGRPDDGTDTEGYEGTEYFVPLRPQKAPVYLWGVKIPLLQRDNWPALVKETGWRRWLFGSTRTRTKEELVDAMNKELEEKIPGVVWNFSQNIRDNVMEALSGVKGDNSLKIFGPDIDKLENLAAEAKGILEDIPGIENVGIFHVRGQSHLEFRVDPEKCQRWGVMTADVNNVIASALGAKPQSNMVEGEKLFDISVRWPQRLRASERSILDIPVDITNNAVVQPQGSGPVPTAPGFALAPPSKSGTQADTSNPMSQQAPRVPLRELVSPVGDDGSADPTGQFERHGASCIYREQASETGKKSISARGRLIAIKFSVRGRDLGGAVAEARARTNDLFEAPYRAIWSGEFEEMEDAENRLLTIIPLSLGLIFILLYTAFRSLLDAFTVLSNVFALAVGGIWALYLTGTNFSISAAVGFISLFGVAIMDGLLLISYFNALRARGLPLQEAIMQGAAKRLRPMLMTDLTALLGLLPAALSTRIGAQTQRPLAIVVVGGMIATLFLTRYLMPVIYSFYGHREPRADSAGLAH
jgi:cobalt-zinc-cadmium resistance protein CzcA